MLTNDVCAEGEGITYKDLAMYTVPAKVPIKAKDLIATFEKGEVSQNSDEPTTNGDTAVITTNGDPTSPGATVRIRMSREVSLDELAQPGTARRLLQEFETRVQQAVAAGVEPPVLRNPNSKAAAFFRNSRSSVTSDDQTNTTQHDQASPTAADASPVVEQVQQAISEVPEPQCNGGTDTTVASETENVASPPSTAAAAVEVATAIAAVAEVAAVEHAVVETAVAEVASADNTSSSVPAPEDVPPADVAVHSETNNVEGASDNAATDASVDAVASNTVLLISALREKTQLAESLLQLFHNSQHQLLLTDVNSGNIVADEERQKLEAADLVVIHFQPVLNCVPASLQGWFETVFASGHVLGSSKNCVVLLTTPHQREDFSSTGALGDVEANLRPLQHGLLRQVGFNVLQPQVIYNETSSDLSDVIAQLSARLENIWNEQPVISP